MVISVSDDHGLACSSVYGTEAFRTPNMDRLASEGMVFHRGFTATAMCSPSRSVLYTGLYPHRNGAHRNHSDVRPRVESLPDYLGRQGYRVALAGKRHIGPEEAFPFEYVPFEGVAAFLQDLAEDPHELNNLAGEPEQARRVARLRAELEAWVEQQGDPLLNQLTETLPVAR